MFSVRDGCLRISGDGLGYLATKQRFRDNRLSLEFRWGDQEGLDRRRWQRQGKALDSGVFLHARGPHGNSHDGDGAFMAAIECNLFEGACGDILLIRGDDEEGRLIAPRVTHEATEERDSEGFAWWRVDGAPVTLTRWGRVNRLHKSPGWTDRRGVRSDPPLEKPTGQWNTLECRCQGGSITIHLNGTQVNHVTKVFPDEGRILLQCEGAEIHFRRITLHPLGRPD